MFDPDFDPDFHIQLGPSPCCVIIVVLALPTSPQSPPRPCLTPHLLYSGVTMFQGPKRI